MPCECDLEDTAAMSISSRQTISTIRYLLSCGAKTVLSPVVLSKAISRAQSHGRTGTHSKQTISYRVFRFSQTFIAEPLQR